MSTPIKPHLEQYFSSMGWKYRPSEDGAFFVLDFDGTHGSWRTYVFFSDDLHWISVVSNFPGIAREDRRINFTELVCRINHELPIAYMDFDIVTGRVLLRCELLLGDVDPTPSMLSSAFERNFTPLDALYPYIAQAMFSERSAAEIYADYRNRLPISGAD